MKTRSFTNGESGSGSAFLVGLSMILATSVILFASETIVVDGTTYPNAEMVEVAPDGAAFQVAEGELVIVPWASLSPAQLSAIRARFPGAVENAMFEAYWVKGTVFQVNRDGVVIQITIPEKGEKAPPFRNGA
ncbi:MAG: hypothetical protein AAGC68_05835, partial [Verrucomicrobiota bacterium]